MLETRVVESTGDFLTFIVSKLLITLSFLVPRNGKPSGILEERESNGSFFLLKCIIHKVENISFCFSLVSYTHTHTHTHTHTLEEANEMAFSISGTMENKT